MRFPDPEFLFTASSEAEWVQGRRQMLTPVSSCTVSLTLAALLCNAADSVQLPFTLMGRFVLLHGKSHPNSIVITTSSLTTSLKGILQHAWRTKRVFLENRESLSDTSFRPYLASKASTIHSALVKWRHGWHEDLLDFELFPVQPSLYQDRAEACWYLAGILALPHVIIATPKVSMSNTDQCLSVHDMLARLMTLSDQRRLDSHAPDFAAIYRIISEISAESHKNVPLGGLIYRERDSTRAGFED